MFGAVRLTKNADIDHYKYYGYGVGSDRKGEFSFGSRGFDRNCIIFEADLANSSRANKIESNILDLGEDFVQGINGTAIYAEKMYSINLTENNKKICLSLHYNKTNIYLLMRQTFVSLKQKILKLYLIHYV